MERCKALLRRLRAEAYERTGVSRRARGRIDGSCAVVLAYHRVLPLAEAERLAVEPGMVVTPETFRDHVAMLSRHFRVMPLGELIERWRNGAALPPRACAITFDDGWRDNHQYAFPILREAGHPATIFLVTERVGTEGAFWPDEVCRRIAALAPVDRREAARAMLDHAPSGRPVDDVLALLKQLSEPERERALGRLRVLAPAAPAYERELLDWDEVDEMSRCGVAFESHGATHAILTTLPPARVHAELRIARDALRERGLGRDELVAYPSGACDVGVMEEARRIGVRAAFATRPGLVSSDAFHLNLPRLSLHQDIAASPAAFLYQVPGRAFRN